MDVSDGVNPPNSDRQNRPNSGCESLIGKSPRTNVRDLIRRDRERQEQRAFEALKATLQEAFDQPDDSYVDVTLEDVIARNTARTK